MSESKIAGMRVDELVSRYPPTLHLLHNFGIDRRSGRNRTLEEIANAHGIEADLLLEVLAAAIDLIEDAERTARAAGSAGHGHR